MRDPSSKTESGHATWDNLVEGFRELAIALQQAAHGSTGRRDAIRNVARAYLAFASEHPALYEAMFTLPTGLRFAQADTKAELKAAFAALAAVVTPSNGDDEVATETYWRPCMDWLS